MAVIPGEDDERVRTMRIRKGLLFWNLRQLRSVTLVAVPAAALYTLFAPGYIDITSPWPALFIFGHAIAMAVSLGRFRTGQFGFLYSRGYGRDTLWTHAMVASIMGAFVAVLPASLILRLRIRSLVQDLLKSPYYPGIMEPQDAVAPWLWLFFYLFLIPLVNYAWVRNAHPARGETAGRGLVIFVAFASLPLFAIRPPFPGFFTLVFAAAILVGLIVLIASRFVHRGLEVQG